MIIAVCFFKQHRIWSKKPSLLHVLSFSVILPTERLRKKAKNVLYEVLLSINFFAQVSVGMAEGVILN